VRAIQRQVPDSPRDFSFRILTKSHKRILRIDPGNGATYRRWEEGLLTALSMPRAAAARLSGRRSQAAA